MEDIKTSHSCSTFGKWHTDSIILSTCTAATEGCPMDELLVVVHDRADHSKRSLSIPFTLNDTVQSIEEKISARTGVPPELLKRAKLRVYCNECASSAVLVKKEPSRWRDVLKSRQIEVNCADCRATSYAAFCFKCIKCYEALQICPMRLRHRRSNNNYDTSYDKEVSRLQGEH
ncbi:hypothetical protein TELCIR_17947 [Teladorsagia circumcincta]|uniref:Parkin RING/Ubox like zinc-binding domain-containing protein n=1 Tax=Teladorsagia circumcincta TaxID=45464 RepID=A0A2G9TRJ6_TELCI|nr:hypothetical protein TELCIR_17947 [Teladorsagia circumcincta]